MYKYYMYYFYQRSNCALTVHCWDGLTSLAEVVAVEEEGDKHSEDGGARQRDQHDGPYRQVVVVLVRVVFRVFL